MSLIGTQQDRRHQWVRRDAANAATKSMTQDAHLKIVGKTGSITNRKQHAGACEHIHTVVNGCQFTIYHTADVRQELCDQFMAARNGNPSWLKQAFVCTVCENEHHEVVSCGIFADEYPDKQPPDCMKQAWITSHEATEGYMVEVIAASHRLKQQLTSCRYSTCLLQWQGNEVVYSWNSPTCAWPWTWPKCPKNGFRALR